jgi:hypothetical protein
MVHTCHRDNLQPLVQGLSGFCWKRESCTNQAGECRDGRESLQKGVSALQPQRAALVLLLIMRQMF